MADKAALFGINEYKTVSPLRGCENDVNNMRLLLTTELGFDPKNVRTFVNGKVTKTEVQRQMRWLFRDVSEGDRVVLHFSGHGSQTVDLNNDEADNADEIFCLVDMDFSDPESYLLDDELNAWTSTKPAGVELTIVLDTCHSGTGTRLLVSPGRNQPERSMNVDAQATVKRSITRSAGGTRDLGIRALDVAAAAVDPDNEMLVRVRFVDPPPAIKAAIADRGLQLRSRESVSADLNHVLLAACDATQTAADATLGGEPNGAFTYYLCETLRAGGASLDRQALIDRVASSLQTGQFSQTPQLEQGPAGSGPLFGPSRGTPVATPSSLPVTGSPVASTSVGADATTMLDLLSKIVGAGQTLDAGAQKQALEILSRLMGTGPITSVQRGVGGRVLVTVHGICRHLAGYSNPWWTALKRWTTAYGSGTLGDTRREVLWSDIVNQRGIRGMDDDDATEAERAEFAARVRGVLEDRAAMEGLQEVRSVSAARNLIAPEDPTTSRGLSIPGLNCIDDFSVYMFDSSVRAQVIGRFTTLVRPLLDAGTEIDIISHSWGTVVAYEGLRELGAGFTNPLVRNFFTVGAALSLFPVRQRLRPANRDGRKPALVRKWINLDAKGDPVGGRLKDQPYQVDEETLDLPNLGCGFFDASCAHSSYFNEDNVRVNRDIFARNINSA